VVRPKHVYGYVVGQYAVKMNAPDKFLSIRVRPSAYNPHCQKYKPAAFLPSFHVSDKHTKVPVYLPFFCDRDSPANQIAAIVHRFGRRMKPIDPATIADFNEFAKEFIRLYFEKLTKEELYTFLQWLEKTPYPGSRKKTLSILRNEDVDLCKVIESKSFLKFEGYQEPKNPRAINSPTDHSKSLLGQFIAAIDKKTFKNKWFVKGIAPKLWPQMLLNAFSNNPVMGTDFSSFEAHHREAYSEVILFWMQHMLRDVGVPAHVRLLLARMVLGSNHTVFKDVSATVEQRLMSGSLWTSSANGVLNLLIMAYLNCRSSDPLSDPRVLARNVDQYFTGFVEGDDGICLDRDVDPQLVERMGLDLKWDKHPTFETASFCGIVCGVSDIDKGFTSVCCNPLKVLRNFFVLPVQCSTMRESSQLAFLRAKALSYKYNYSDCPIVGKLCDRVLRDTAGIDISRVKHLFDSYKLEWAVAAHNHSLWRLPAKVTAESRSIVERVFKISYSEQLRIEREIEDSPARHLFLDLWPYVSTDDLHYALTYAVNGKLDHVQHEYPDEVQWILQDGQHPTPYDDAPTKSFRCKRLDGNFEKRRKPQIYFEPEANHFQNN
jgi:hypothetical protein